MYFQRRIHVQAMDAVLPKLDCRTSVRLRPCTSRGPYRTRACERRPCAASRLPISSAAGSRTTPPFPSSAAAPMSGHGRARRAMAEAEASLKLEPDLRFSEDSPLVPDGGSAVRFPNSEEPCWGSSSSCRSSAGMPYSTRLFFTLSDWDPRHLSKKS
jgi:hypothetical protein